MTMDKKFDLGNYVEVKDRLAILYELYPQARLVTDKVKVLTAPDGKQRVMVKALVYRTSDDPHPAVGYSWMELPGTTSYTKGSELENTETSAWGRAIAALGILVDKSIASQQEIRNKSDEADPVPEHTGSDGLIGTVEPGKPPVDMELRQTPDGPAWGFKLKNGRRAYQVLAKGQLADALAILDGPEHKLTGARVTCWGHIEMIPWDKDGKAMPPYPRVNLERIQTPDWTLPAPAGATETPAEPVEAPSIPMLLDETERAAVGGGLPG
jgi:hypothetical protein